MSNTNIANRITIVADSLGKKGSPMSEELRRIAQYLSSGDDSIMHDMPYNPMIQPFAKITEAPPKDDRETHTTSVTFKVPEGVSEAEIMHAIMNSVKDLGVDIDGFSWKKSETKGKN
jgi:hypothetical protein